MKVLVKCCEKFEEQLADTTLMCLMKNEPFSRKRLPEPAVYLMSDGGHGGMEKASYCPFCGTPIKIAEVISITEE